MDIKKILLYGGAGIFIFIGGCTVLTMGGCASLIGITAWQVSNLPEYVDREIISEKYGDDFGHIHHALENKTPLEYSAKNTDLHQDVLAIFTDVNGKEEDIYMRYKDCSKTSVIMLNGTGLATLEYEGRSAKTIAYEISHNTHTYIVCIKDTFADSKK